jgi:hypothetical protein
LPKIFILKAIAKLDEERRVCNFKKVLMLCPPVTLYPAVTILDAMLDDDVPTDAEGIQAHIDHVFGKLAGVYEKNQHVEFVGDLLYIASQQLHPDEKALTDLIGLVFRFTATNMVFTSDVMCNAGFLVRRDLGQTLGVWGGGPGALSGTPRPGIVLGPGWGALGVDWYVKTSIRNAVVDLETWQVWALSGLKAIDSRYRTGFLCHETGSPFEDDLIGLFYTKKREFQVAV